MIGTNNALLPIEPAVDSYRYPRLNFVPSTLRLTPLLILSFLCVLMITALIFCSVWSTKRNGLTSYNGVGTGKYFIFEFLPQLLACGIVLWLVIIQSAIHRVLPFQLLASGRHSEESSVIQRAALYPTNYLLPRFEFFRQREPSLGACSIIFWLSLFTIPLQSALFQTRLYSLDDSETWQWTTAQPVAWSLIILYALLVAALILLLIRFTNTRTGLKWDATSLADMLVLIHRSNNDSSHRTSRNSQLGYWSNSHRPNDIFYGLNSDQPSPRPSFTREKQQRGSIQKSQISAPVLNCDPEKQKQTATGGSSHSEEAIQSHSEQHSSNRRAWIPWFLRDTFIVLWLVIALILLLAFLISSYLHSAVANGFLPQLPAPTTNLAFSPANFLYSFVPSLLGLLLYLLWLPIDHSFRALEPFAQLSRPDGASAALSLLLEYNTNLPISVSIRALAHGHYRVAFISLVSLLALALPVLAGGLFTAQFFESTQSVREAAYMPAYYVLTVFLTIYAISYCTIWPTKRRYLPHDISKLGGLMALLASSPIRSDTAFREPRSRIDLVTRLVSAHGGFGGGDGSSPSNPSPRGSRSGLNGRTRDVRYCLGFGIGVEGEKGIEQEGRGSWGIRRFEGELKNVAKSKFSWGK